MNKAATTPVRTTATVDFDIDEIAFTLACYAQQGGALAWTLSNRVISHLASHMSISTPSRRGDALAKVYEAATNPQADLIRRFTEKK